jgi:hypothetical protein
MPVSKKKKARRAPVNLPADVREQLRPGMPAKDSVQEVLDFVSPQGVHYPTLRTNEMDAYDPPPKSQNKRRSKS